MEEKQVFLVSLVRQNGFWCLLVEKKCLQLRIVKKDNAYAKSIKGHSGRHVYDDYWRSVS